MADNDSSGITAIVAIIAIVVVLGVAYLVVQNMRGTSAQPAGINVNLGGSAGSTK